LAAGKELSFGAKKTTPTGLEMFKAEPIAVSCRAVQSRGGGLRPKK